MTELSSDQRSDLQHQRSSAATCVRNQSRDRRIVCDTRLSRISFRDPSGRSSRDITVAVAVGPNSSVSVGAALGYSRSTRVAALRKALHTAVAAAMDANDDAISFCIVADEALEPEITALRQSMPGPTFSVTYSLPIDSDAKAAVERVFESIHRARELPIPVPPIIEVVIFSGSWKFGLGPCAPRWRHEIVCGRRDTARQRRRCEYAISHRKCGRRRDMTEGMPISAPWL